LEPDRGHPIAAARLQEGQKRVPELPAAEYRANRSTLRVTSVAWLGPSPAAWEAGPKSEMQFNGVGRWRSYISFGTFFAAANGAPRAVSPDPVQMVHRQKNPTLTRQNLEKQIARCRRDLSRMGDDAATESLRAFLADLEDRLRNLETQ
jgi:hypothetical protein